MWKKRKSIVDDKKNGNKIFWWKFEKKFFFVVVVVSCLKNLFIYFFPSLVSFFQFRDMAKFLLLLDSSEFNKIVVEPYFMTDLPSGWCGISNIFTSMSFNAMFVYFFFFDAILCSGTFNDPCVCVCVFVYVSWHEFIFPVINRIFRRVNSNFECVKNTTIHSTMLFLSNNIYNTYL